MHLGMSPAYGRVSIFTTYKISVPKISTHLSRKFTDQILRKLLQLISVQPWKRFRHRRPQAHQVWIVNTIQTKRHYVATPFACRAAGATAGWDSAPVKGDGDVEGALLRHRLCRDHCATKVEACKIKNTKILSMKMLLREHYFFALI